MSDAATEIRVRPMQPGDGAALAQLHRTAILATSGEYSQEERESWAAGLVADGYARSVADGEIIEVALDAAGLPIAFCGRKAGSVAGLYVDPAHQRRGIATMLLELAEAAIRREGAARITVEASLPAVAFYSARGYEPTKEHHDTTRGGLSIRVLRMEKSLT